jgi:hypothetical protein
MLADLPLDERVRRAKAAAKGRRVNIDGVLRLLRQKLREYAAQHRSRAAVVNAVERLEAYAYGWEHRRSA